MKGILPKLISSKTIPCKTCIFFCDEDEDIYYCQLDQIEFPKKCERYQIEEREK